MLDIDPSRIVEKERLHPGKMLLVDTKQGKIIDDDELKEYYANRQPYGEWLDHNLVNLSDLKIPNQRIEEYTPVSYTHLIVHQIRCTLFRGFHVDPCGLHMDFYCH